MTRLLRQADRLGDYIVATPARYRTFQILSLTLIVGCALIARPPIAVVDWILCGWNLNIWFRYEMQRRAEMNAHIALHVELWYTQVLRWRWILAVGRGLPAYLVLSLLRQDWAYYSGRRLHALRAVLVTVESVHEPAD